MARGYFRLAAGDFGFQETDAFFQLMRGKRRNILAKLKAGSFLARGDIVAIHGKAFPVRLR